MPFNIGPGELILVLVIALVVIGPGKLPEVGSALGKSIREFRKASTDVQDAAKIDTSPTPTPTPTPTSPPAAPATPEPVATPPAGVTPPTDPTTEPNH
jgi:sec-independent protein translocase protein TatA